MGNELLELSDEDGVGPEIWNTRGVGEVGGETGADLIVEDYGDAVVGC